MIDFAIIPVSDHARVKKLMGLIQRAVAGEESFDAELQADWYKQLVSLAGKGNVQDWFSNLRFIFIAADYRLLLAAVVDYQQAPPVLYEENFDDSERCCHALSNRIKLLYEIGHLAGILEASEKFNEHTRVTQTQQDVCDRVIQWVEEYLALNMGHLNVYVHEELCSVQAFTGGKSVSNRCQSRVNYRSISDAISASGSKKGHSLGQREV